MKISDLISTFQELQEKHGDITVQVVSSNSKGWEPEFMEDYNEKLDANYIPSLGIKSILYSDHRWDNGSTIKIVPY